MGSARATGDGREPSTAPEVVAAIHDGFARQDFEAVLALDRRLRRHPRMPRVAGRGRRRRRGQYFIDSVAMLEALGAPG